MLEIVEAGVTAAREGLARDEPGRVPEAVRERVMSSIVVSERVILGDGGDRDAGHASRVGGSLPSTELHWTVTFDRGLDPSDPSLRAAADRELARMREWYGP